MTRQNVRISLVAVVLIGAAGMAAGQTEELVRVIAMEPGGRFTLGNVSGDITVTGVDGDDLTIRATKRVAGRGSTATDALDRVEIDIEERGNRVVVETDYPRHRRSFLESLASLFSGGGREPFVAVDYLVTVPRGTAVAVESFDGDVTVEGVDGETHVKTVSGAGRLASLARLVAVETSSGDLEIADVRSDEVLTAETVSGRIDIERVRVPRLQVKSFDGAVALEGVESRRVAVETVSGSVTFDGALAADGRYELRSHSGGILLTVPDGSGFELDARSFSGDLRSDIPILVGRDNPSRQTPVFEGGRRAIRGIAAAGGAHLELYTVSGDMAIGIRSSALLQPAASRPAGSIDIR
ncbi:MAG: DUF4097 domain-containing protein [Acidobacteria bacterium]|nr:DUF4097 domain-containing protein [Acidobacteriota bacterium]